MQNGLVRTSIVDLKPETLLDPAVPPLASAAVHVWELGLAVAQSTTTQYSKLLSADEISRAARFHFDRDARRFKVSRGLVRSILAAYTHVPARELRFAYSKHGKPSLIEPAGKIRFSVSHSVDAAMLAVALDREVGVDIEAMREDVETDRLAERFFSVVERGAIRALPASVRVSAFFRCWTCKEAFLKAQGVGLFRSLGSFDVEVNPDLPAHLVATRPDVDEYRNWSLHDVKTLPGFAAAVAVEGSVVELKVLRCRG